MHVKNSWNSEKYMKIGAKLLINAKNNPKMTLLELEYRLIMLRSISEPQIFFAPKNENFM